ncbi:hypothetical protein D5I55_12915 [Chakrabartia godavariana]|nr:hypothetical protein D5I55_12915 [Chakrabartia godavariana]
MRHQAKAAQAWRVDLAFWCLLVLFALLITLTRRGAETWTSADFGLYVMHARNLVDGVPYAATAYIPNPHNSIISPAAYPFGYPLLLSLPFASRGLSMPALELVGCLSLIAIVAALWVMARRRLDGGWGLVAALGAGCVPQLLDLRDTISSDLAFTAWVMLALCLHARAEKAPALLALFLAVFMAEATRSAGIALAAALIATDLLARRRGWQVRLAMTAGGTAAAILVNHLLGADAAGTYMSYLDRVREAPGAFLLHAVEDYLVGLSHALGFSFGKAGNLAVLGLFGLLALLGWGRTLSRGLSADLLFLPASAALLLAFPVRLETARYLVPLLPLLVLYAVDGAALLARGGRFAPPVAAAALLIGFGGRYLERNPFAPLPMPAFTAAVANELVRMGAQIPNRAVVLAPNPRVAALYTRDRTSIWPEHPRAEDIWIPARRMGAQYLLLQYPPLDATQARVEAILKARPRGVEPVAQTRHFRLYRFVR